jgi:hypothetical protein
MTMGFLTNLFSKVYIAVYIEDTECNILVHVVKGGKVKATDTKKYFLEKGKFSDSMNKYLMKWQNSYNLVYISTLLSGINQGASESCTKNQLVKIGVPIENVESKCISNTWQTYADVEDIGYTKNLFDFCGIDLMYNTFSLLHYNFKKELKDGVVYILYRKTSLSLAVFKNGSLSFSAYFLTHDEDENVFESAEEEVESEDGGEITVTAEADDELMFFEDEDLELDDLEDNLDEDDDDDDDDDSDDDKEKEKDDKDDSESSASEDDNNELNTIKSEKLFNLIKDSLDEYYKNSIYSSEFVNKIVFADTEGLADDVISYLNDELMIEVDRKEINIAEVLLNISKEEVGN